MLKDLSLTANITTMLLLCLGLCVSCNTSKNLLEEHKSSIWCREDDSKLDSLKIGMTIEEVIFLIKPPVLKVKTINGDTKIEEWRYDTSYDDPDYSLTFYDGILRRIMYKERR